MNSVKEFMEDRFLFSFLIILLDFFFGQNLFVMEDGSGLLFTWVVPNILVYFKAHLQ